MHLYLRTILVALFVFGLCATYTPVHAQRTSGAVGLGGQLGEPTGITLKFYDAVNPSYDFLAAWDLTDDFFFLNAHALFENNIQGQNADPDLHWIIGPGGFIGIDEDPREEAGIEDDAQEEVVLGLSGTIGLNLVFNDRVELYGRFTPRISLTPDTDGAFGGGAGLRYYF